MSGVRFRFTPARPSRVRSASAISLSLRSKTASSTHTQGTRGTCVAFIDPESKPPKYPELGATAVVAGGGEGVIAGGTGKYKVWTGTFTDRVFVGFGDPTRGVGGVVHCDRLLFRISGK